MAGFGDYLRMALGWKASTPVVVPDTVAGPYYVAAGLLFTSGSIIGEANHAGQRAGEVFTAGTVIGESRA